MLRRNRSGGGVATNAGQPEPGGVPGPARQDDDDDDGRERAAPVPGPAADPSLQSLVHAGTLELPQARSPFHVLTIVGQIEGHVHLPGHNKTTKYEHVIPRLVAIELHPEIKGLLVVLNTVGGDVEAGMALAEMLAGMTKPRVSLILGGGHSIGLPVAVACDWCLVAPTATLTIHPIRMTGLILNVPQSFEYLEKMQERVVRFVAEHSRISPERYRELMYRTGELARDVGTVLVGGDAVREGLADAVGGLQDALLKLDELARLRESGEKEPAPSPMH